MRSASFVARCPAKINLTLRVLARRPDGYHELNTIFQAIDLWDVLEIAPAAEVSLACDDPRLPTDGRNLVVRAADAIRLRISRPAGASIRLLKSIPVQAGLGGGSSDAAGALLLCSEFWGLAWTRDELAAVAAELGADVPFFLTGGSARGTGRGDRIEPLAPMPTLQLLLGCPPFGLETAEVFRRASQCLALPRDGGPQALDSAQPCREGMDVSSLANDLEPVVFEGWPVLRRFRDELLEAGAGAALLSGSGSTVYGIFPDRAAVEAGLERLRPRFDGWMLLPTRTVAAGAHVVRGGDRRARGAP